MRTPSFTRLLAAVTPRWLLLALVVLTVLLVAGDLASRHTDLALFSGDSRWHRWNGRRDRGWMELAGYLQLVIAAVLLVAAARRRGPGGRVLAAWAVVLILVVLDDGWMLHKRGGERLVEAYDLPAVAGLRPQDAGELLVWAVLGIAALALVVAAHLASDGRSRRESWRLGGLVAVLGVFAVGVDMKRLVVDVTEDTWLVEVLTLLESGGELLAMSLVLVYAVVIARRTLVPRAALPEPRPSDHSSPPAPEEAGRPRTTTGVRDHGKAGRKS